MKLVVKYGGISISSSEDIADVARYIHTLSSQNQVVVVCSATIGTTDGLIGISESIKRGDKSKAVQIATKIIRRHIELAKKTIKRQTISKKLLKSLDHEFTQLRALIDGMTLLREITPKTMDHLFSFGERLAIHLMASAISDCGRRTVLYTGKTVGIVTDSNFGESKPLMDTTALRVSKTIEDAFSKKIVPIVGGFTGADQHGHVTTFGRGGSDYTATIIGSCIKADEIWLMSDVDGLTSADPKIVKNARILDELSYSEAIEMTLFGAKQIHPKTFEPLLSKNIPIKIRSSKNVDNEGTLISATPSPDVANTVKCVSSILGNGLIDIYGGSMVGMPGTAAKIFATLAKAGINVMMISQSPSESSITIVVRNADLDRAVNILEMDLLGKIIKKLDITTNMSIIALIGAGMRGTVGVASKVFGAIEEKGINVTMITQGSSELNLAFVVRNSDTINAVRALHDAFWLDKVN